MEAILLVEDDAEIRELVARYLEKQQMDVRVAADGREMDAALAQRGADLIILDLNLPGENGLSICRRLRQDGGTPIVILTAQGEEVDKVVALELGADDYVVKPFSARELLARIRAILRRTHARSENGAERTPRGAAGELYRFAGWTMDLATRQIETPEGASLSLTGAEFDLLHAFCEHPNRILTRDQLISMTHGRGAGPFERSVDILISRLRQRIEDNPKTPKFIKTVRSEGYMFTAEVSRP
jgi:two-component system, OmpR family, response regulator